MGPLIGQFNARYPGIRLTVNEMTQDRIERELADDRLDLGIAFTDTPGRRHTGTAGVDGHDAA
jgi:DNA-binding transcriptional LysR family regulator